LGDIALLTGHEGLDEDTDDGHPRTISMGESRPYSTLG